MNNETNNQLFESFRYPLAIDDSGRCYALREDGAVVSVNEPPLMVSAAYQSKTISWLSTRNGIYFLFDQKKCYLVEGEEGCIGSYLPTYPETVPVTGNDSMHFVLWNHPKSMECLSVDGSIVRKMGEQPDFRGFSGWADEQHLYLLGMKIRQYPWINKLSSFLGEYPIERGHETLLKVNLQNGQQEQLDLDELEYQAKVELTKDAYKYDTKYALIRVEAWLANFEVNSQRLIVGAIADIRPREDDVHMYEGLHWGEFIGTAVFDFDALTLKRLVVGHSFVQKLTLPTQQYMYLIESPECHRHVCGLRALQVDANVADNELVPLVVEGIEPTALVGGCRFYYNESAGIYAIFDILDGTYSGPSYLLRSENGIQWKVVEKFEKIKADED